MSWKLKQSSKLESWLNNANALLHTAYGTDILDLQNEIAIVREAICDLKTNQPVADEIGYPTQFPLVSTKHQFAVDDSAARHLLRKTQIVLLNTLAKCLSVRPHVQVELYLDVLLDAYSEDYNSNTAAKRLLFDLQCQAQVSKGAHHNSSLPK